MGACQGSKKDLWLLVSVSVPGSVAAARSTSLTGGGGLPGGLAIAVPLPAPLSISLLAIGMALAGVNALLELPHGHLPGLVLSDGGVQGGEGQIGPVLSQREPRVSGGLGVIGVESIAG